MPRVRVNALASLLVAVLLIGSAGREAAGGLAPGDILACDPVFGDSGALVVVDPISGNRQILSDLADPTQGPLGEHPWDVALDPVSIVLLDQMIPAVFRVDATTGQRTLLSDLSDGSQGPTASVGWGIASTAGGDLVVAVGNVATAYLLAVDPDTGDRSTLSDFTDPSQGVLGVPMGVVQEPGGDYLVTAFLDSGTSALLRVDAGTGDRMVVSDFGEPGPGILGLTGIAVDAQAQALVLWASSQSCFTQIFRVDPATGTGESVGLLDIHAWDIAVEADGQLLAAGFRGGFCGPPGFNRLYRVDPASGQATFLAADVDSGLAVHLLVTIFTDGFESGDLSAWSEVSP